MASSQSLACPRHLWALELNSKIEKLSFLKERGRYGVQHWTVISLKLTRAGCVLRETVVRLFCCFLQKRVYFRLQNKETGKFMSADGNLDNLNLLRIQVAEDTDSDDQIWVYQDGFIRCRVRFKFNVNFLFFSPIVELSEFNSYCIILIYCIGLFHFSSNIIFL